MVGRFAPHHLSMIFVRLAGLAWVAWASQQSRTLLGKFKSLLCLLCYAMLCYGMLCYAMLCYAMLCYASPEGPIGFNWELAEMQPGTRV